MLVDGTFSKDKELFRPLYNCLLNTINSNKADQYFILKDFESYLSAQKRISSLTEQLKAAKNSNLIYRQRVEASQQRLDTKQQKLEAECQRKDNIIASLKSDIRKTVTASKMQERATSDLGADNRKLMQERDAIEANLQAYQDAYANIYASALGVCFNDLQISSATTVQELQDKIAGATNSANVCPSAAVDELYIDESNDEDLITL
jgi:glycyl-tRNA synthetase beta subunit